MTACRFFARACLLLTSTWPCLGHAELSDVWALDDGTKLAENDTENELASNNGVFDRRSRTVSLFAARNETVAFQVILRGGRTDTHGVSIDLSRVGAIENRNVSDDADEYFVGRHLELFLERYVAVKFRSHSLGWQPDSEAQPEMALGSWPDPLVPISNERAFSVSAGKNQAVWVDIYVPKDAKKGQHRGTLTVRVSNERCPLATCSLKVDLEVLDLSLPDVPTAKTMLWFSGSDGDFERTLARYFEHPKRATAAEKEALRTRHFHLARRHRVSAFLGKSEGPNDELRARLDGSLFTRKRGYEGPGEALGQDFYSIHTYGMPEVTQKETRRWVEWFSRVAPNLDYFYYTRDEPSEEDYPLVNRLARRAEPIAAFTTAPYTSDLEVDIFAALPSAYRPSDKQRAEASGRRYFIYNGVRPFSGSFVIDDLATAPRVNAWIQYKYGIERWFYWEATYYDDFQGGRGAVDVYQSAFNFSNRFGDRMNGDGLLFYPGRDYRFRKHDPGLNQPLPSIRLKNWRRGIQDVEYLELARKRGHSDFVERLLERMIPRALADDVLADDAVSWPESGESWLRARRLLADALTGGQAPPLPAGLGADRARGSWFRSVRLAWRDVGVARWGLGFTLVVSLSLVALLLIRPLHRSKRRRVSPKDT